jgi:hypothetical protein
MATITKTVPQLRAGDVVVQHGGRFLVTADAQESCGHRPRWPNAGPSDCAWAPSICLTGEIPGYFRPGSAWRQQGNHLARVSVEVS